MKKTLLALFALTLCVGAFAEATGIPLANQVLPAPDPVAKELADTKAQLAQTQQAAQVEINRLSVLAERNEFAYRLQVANEQNVALRNEANAANTRAADLQAKLNDLTAKYGMEQAKVEALLKKHPGEGVTASAAVKPEGPAKTETPTSNAKK